VQPPAEFDPIRTMGGWAPMSPAPAPDPMDFKQGDPRRKGTGMGVWGASGTPITSGFLLDLGEYNPDLYGRVAIQTYEKMRRGDAMVWATLRAAKQPQWSATWEVQPGVRPNDPGYDLAKEIADFVRDNLFGGLEFTNSLGAVESQPFHSVLYNALLMLDFGCAVHEDVYSVDGKNVRLRSLPGRLPLTFYRWHPEADGETLLALEQYGYRGDKFVNVTLPANKMCRFTYNQEGANYWGIAMLRPMYGHWYIVNSLYRIDAIAGERNGMGVPVVTLAPSPNSSDVATAWNTVTKLAAHEKTGIVLPNGSTFELIGVAGQVRDLLATIEHHKRQMSFSALQHFLTIGSAPHGSRATAQTQHGFFIAASKHLADQISEAITQSTIRRLVRYNFGTNAPIPKLMVKNIKSEDFSNIIEALTNLASADLIVSDKQLRAHIRENLDLPEETDEDVISTSSPESQQAVETNLKSQEDVEVLGPKTPQNKDSAENIGKGMSKALVPGQGLMSSEAAKKTNLAGTGKPFVFFTDQHKEFEPVLYVARHGQTEEDKKGADMVSGWRDIPLDEVGIKQAEALGEELKGKGIAEIHSSDIRRAHQTAEIVAKALGVPLILEPGLRSWGLGSLAGKPVSGVKDDINAGIAHPYVAPAKDAEPRSDFVERLAATMRKMSERSKELGKPILLVAHSWNAGEIPSLLRGQKVASRGKMPPGGAEKLERDKKGNWSIQTLSTASAGEEGASANRDNPLGLTIVDWRTDGRAMRMDSLNHEGIMVALEVPQDVAEALGTEEDVPHITLAYVPPENIGLDDAGTIARIASELASKQPPLSGKVGGIGRFLASPTSDGKDVIYASVDVPGLNEFRAALVQKLAKAGIQPSNTHGFSPHITLQYVDPDDKSSPSIGPVPPLPLSTLIVAQANTVLAEETLIGGAVKIGSKNIPPHFNLDAAANAVKHSANELLKVMTGREQTRVIVEIARQAVAQMKRGIPVSELRFSAPPDLEPKLRVAISKLTVESKAQAKKEIEGALKA
jgi:broad specificity phosphatase PhoE/2'-5' RNA ligase